MQVSGATEEGVEAPKTQRKHTLIELHSIQHLRLRAAEVPRI